MSDDEILKQAVGGDRAALTELFRRHAPALRQSAATQIPRHWQSLFSEDDVMQQTFADAFRGIGGFSGADQSSFAAWLASLANCNLRDAIRGLEAKKRSPERQPMSVAAVDESFVALCDLLSASGSTPSGHFARDEARSDLNLAIGQLPQAYRFVVQKYDLEGQSAQEVGVELGRSPGAVYMLRARALDRLREILVSASRFFTIAVSTLVGLRLIA